MEHKYRTVTLFLLLLLFAYLSFRIIQPFMNYLLLGAILTVLCFPLHQRLIKRMHSGLAAGLILLGVALIVILPSFWLGTSLVSQASDAYQLAQQRGISLASARFPDGLGELLGIDMQRALDEMFSASKLFIASSLPNLVASTGTIAIGIFMVFFLLYYGLKEGSGWYLRLSESLPLKQEYKTQMRTEIARMTRVLFFGQVLVSALVGIASGLVFWLVGVSNPVFWGFVMLVFTFLPFVGAPLVYIPAGIFLILDSRWLAGILLIILCSIILIVADYMLKPKLVGRAAQVHPLTIFVGAIGGVYLLGIAGFILGPLILNLFLLFLTFDYTE
jgi:predicted PurR-regulated permease PerM